MTSKEAVYSMIRRSLNEVGNDIVSEFKASSDFDHEATTILYKQLDKIKRSKNKNLQFKHIIGSVYDANSGRVFPHRWIEFRSVESHSDVIIDITGFRFTFLRDLFPVNEHVITDIDEIICRLTMHLKFTKESLIDYMLKHCMFDRTLEMENIYRK